MTVMLVHIYEAEELRDDDRLRLCVYGKFYTPFMNWRMREEACSSGFV